MELLDAKTLSRVIIDDGDGTEIPEGEVRLADYEWQALDAAVARRVKLYLRETDYLISRGAVYDVAEAAKIIAEFQAFKNNTEIADPRLIVKEWPIPTVWREFPAYAENGKLNITAAEAATRRVCEGVEFLLFNGLQDDEGAMTFGLRTFPARKQLSFPASIVSVKESTEKAIVDLVISMMEESLKGHHFGPWLLYHGLEWDVIFDSEYAPNSDCTLKQRFMRLDGISDVRKSENMPGHELLLVQYTTDVVRIAVVTRPVLYQHKGGMMRVAAQMMPQLRSDFENRTGIVHAIPK